MFDALMHAFDRPLQAAGGGGLFGGDVGTRRSLIATKQRLNILKAAFDPGGDDLFACQPPASAIQTMTATAGIDNGKLTEESALFYLEYENKR